MIETSSTPKRMEPLIGFELYKNHSKFETIGLAWNLKGISVQSSTLVSVETEALEERN
jgi:hypothetical protein